jgi:peptide chain release factor 1
LVLDGLVELMQLKIVARALSLLKARLLDEQLGEQNRVQAESRRLQVGSGDRSQRIRTYNFPQGRVTDHRVNLTLYRLQEILAGDLDELVDTLRREDQVDQLQQFGA